MLPMLLMLGCAESYALAGKASDSGGVSLRDTSSSDSAITIPDIAPAWFVPRLSLQVENGVAVATGATLSLEIIGEDLSTVLCTVDLANADLGADESPETDAPLWWTVSVVPENRACAILPERLGLGIGAMVPDIQARLGSVGLSDAAVSLFGAYIQVDTEPVYVYGYAGTAADIAGETVAALPPPDGQYTLAPLYVLALPAQ